jgi:SAM-dependent methyltransferase
LKTPEPLGSALAWSAVGRSQGHLIRERWLALAYGLTYDAIVRGFRPYEALLDEVVVRVARSGPARATPRSTKVLDIACGTGTVAFRLAREGYAVHGLDPVEQLIAVAREKSRLHPASNLAFHHLDLASEPVPGAGSFDVLVSMHTLYWHPNPRGLLEGCRRALRPGGYGIFLTYSRPAHLFETFRQIRGEKGMGEAIRALRWLIPTAVFEMVRRTERRYLSQEEFRRALADAGFELLESSRTFLAQISLLAWVRAPGGEAVREPVSEKSGRGSA